MDLDNNRNGGTPTFFFLTLALGIFPWIPSLISTRYSVLHDFFFDILCYYVQLPLYETFQPK